MRGFNGPIPKTFSLFPKGIFHFVCVAAEPGLSKPKYDGDPGTARITLTWEARNTPDGEYDGWTIKDWLVTDAEKARKENKFGYLSMQVEKWNQLGIGKSNDVGAIEFPEIDDNDLASQLIGLSIDAEIIHQDRKNESTGQIELDPATGIPLKNANIKRYIPAMAIATQTIPQQQAFTPVHQMPQTPQAPQVFHTPMPVYPVPPQAPQMPIPQAPIQQAFKAPPKNNKVTIS